MHKFFPLLNVGEQLPQGRIGNQNYCIGIDIPKVLEIVAVRKCVLLEVNIIQKKAIHDTTMTKNIPQIGCFFIKFKILVVKDFPFPTSIF